MTFEVLHMASDAGLWSRQRNVRGRGKVTCRVVVPGWVGEMQIDD